MSDINDSILNYSYLTCIFYNYIIISGKNFDKIKLPLNDEKFDKEFETSNYQNYISSLI